MEEDIALKVAIAIYYNIIVPDFRNKKAKMVLNLKTCSLASFKPVK